MRLNLDIYRFQGDLTVGRWVNKVERDATGGRRAGVTGTPTFYVNSRRAPRDYEELRAAIDRLLK
jgi:protein-disulfide isomerase